MPSAAAGNGCVPGGASTTVVAPRCGARLAACANFDENSPNTRCWLRASIRPKVATSQKVVEPPLPSSTSQPSGSPNSAARPSRTLRTTCFTGAWRWDVPIQEPPTAASAAMASGLTLDGPHPKRPSAGNSPAGI